MERFLTLQTLEAATTITYWQSPWLNDEKG
ncbi:hypothetical protein FHS54_003016 [Sphingobium vermicomposti]|uniref:Uncharacterized protein n=1 Tax=Sphingobium vermicomposti TaxID=529005 RepID=A0A846MHX6_9SPHN|nr:hypothetical protein [Sphingobium vermicomposti]